jgi:hypothetical protein
MAMKHFIQSLEAQSVGGRDFKTPPLHLWHPSLSGDIPVRISQAGTWYHEGVEIQRASIVRLFASILRREDDGEYYLVTPVEKWRIQVERHALLIVDIDRKQFADEQLLEATLNTDAQLPINEQHPLFLDQAIGNIAAMRLPHGLTALCTRAAWTRLVELADENFTLTSGSYRFSLSA